MSSKEIFNDYFFSYLSSFFFIIGLIVYVYYLILEYKESLEDQKDRDVQKVREDTESNMSKNMWRWTFLVMLLSGFFISSYCLYK